MKKIAIYLFSILLITTVVSSCKKTNTRKLTGDWILSSMDQSTTITSNGSTTTESISISGTTVTLTTTDASGTNTTTGVLNSATWSITKEGTYSRVIDMTFDYSGTGFTATVNTVMDDSGTWSFIGKNKSADLKANDRITFNSLTSSTLNTSSYTVSGNTTTDTDSEVSSYAEGENSDIFQVESSTSKELTLVQVTNNTSTTTNSSGSSTYSSTSTGSYSMTQE